MEGPGAAAPSVQTYLTQLDSPDWRVRYLAAKELVEGEPNRTLADRLGTLAAAADEDVDVRSAAIGALLRIEPDRATAMRSLLGFLGDPLRIIRVSAALALRASQIEAGDSAVDELWQRLLHEGDLSTQEALSQVLAGHGSGLDRAKLELGQASTRSSARGAALVIAAILEGGWIADQEVHALVFAAAGRVEGADVLGALELDAQLFAWGSDAASAALELVADDGVSDVRKALAVLLFEKAGQALPGTPAQVESACRALIAWRADWTVDEPAAAYYSEGEGDLLTEAAGAISWYSPPTLDLPEDLMLWLQPRLDDVPPDLASEVSEVLWRAIDRVPVALVLQLALLTPEVTFSQIRQRTATSDAAGVGRAVLAAQRSEFADAVTDHASDLVDFVIALLRAPDSEEASTWIAQRINTFEPGSFEAIRKELKRVGSLGRNNADLQEKIERILSDLEHRERRDSTGRLIEKLRAGDDETAKQALDSLDGLITADAPRALVEEWVRWLAAGERATLVEQAADRLRRKASAVLPLLEAFGREVVMTDELRSRLAAEAIRPDIAAMIDKVMGGEELSEENRARLQKWIYSAHGSEAPAVAIYSPTGSIDRDRVNEFIEGRIEVARARRQLDVHRRIARQLAEMSEERFFQPASKYAATYDSVKGQLLLHAVPILGRRLPRDEDVEIRERVAQTLGNLGGREAVDILARAVAGEEATRASRQGLLADYYLKPSRERSDDAAKLLKSVVKQARQTLRVLQILNLVFACIGLGLLALGVVMVITNTDPKVQFTGGLISVTSFVGLMLQIIREPLDRIQEAMNRLVQVEAAFTSFIRELDLNATFIQSQYVANGILTSADVGETVERIESAMRLSMELVATYADKGGSSRLTPYITSIVPSVVRGGDRVRVEGAWLSGGRSSRQIQGAAIYLDHAPIPARVTSWSDKEVEFLVPVEVLAEDATGPALRRLSLAVNGRETNAVQISIRV